MTKSQRDSAPEHRGRSFSTTSDTAVESFRAEYQQMAREKADLEREKQEFLNTIKALEYEKVWQLLCEESFFSAATKNADFSFFFSFPHPSRVILLKRRRSSIPRSMSWRRPLR